MANRSINSYTKPAWPSGLNWRPAICLITMLAAASILFSPARAGAQPADASALSGQITTPFGGPAASATVLICPVTANGVPCDTTGATLYSDYDLTQTQPNPLSTDQYGNYKTFIVAGLYQVQVTLAGNSQPTFVYYQAAGPATPNFGTVTSFSSGNLAPLFTTNVTNPTSTVDQTFSLSQAANFTFFGNFSGASASPFYWTLAAGTGIGLTTSSGNTLTITNTGVTKLLAGAGISLSPTNGLGNVTITNTLSAGCATISLGGDCVSNNPTVTQAIDQPDATEFAYGDPNGNGTTFTASATAPEIYSQLSADGSFTNSDSWISADMNVNSEVGGAGFDILTYPAASTTYNPAFQHQYDFDNDGMLVITNSVTIQTDPGGNIELTPGIESTGPGAPAHSSSIELLGNITVGGGGTDTCGTDGHFCTTTSMSYTVAADGAGYDMFNLDASSGAFTVTLPPAAGPSANLATTLWFYKGDSTANAITLAAGSSDTINGASSITIATPYQLVHLLSNGLHGWFVTGATGTESDQYNSVAGCTFATDGANLTCTMNVTLATPMADTSYTVGYSEYTNPAVGSAIYDNISYTITDASHYVVTEMTSGSSTIFSGFCGGSACAYGKSFLFHAHHN